MPVPSAIAPRRRTSSGRRRLRHALHEGTALYRSIKDIDAWLLLMDYDGTLTPIVATPEQARLSQGMRATLRRVAALRGIRVGIVSGRSLRDVRRLVRIPGLVYVGNHGCEISGPGLHFNHPGARRSRVHLRRIATQLCTALASVRGSRVEAKGVSLSIHWRQVAAGNVRTFHRTVQRILRPWIAEGTVRLTRGKRVVEVRAPVAWDKGRAVEWLAGHLRNPRPTRVCYLGDDLTDEDAFRVVNRLRGVSVFIGGRHRATDARWQLTDSGEVRRFLQRVAVTRSARAGHGRG